MVYVTRASKLYSFFAEARILFFSFAPAAYQSRFVDQALDCARVSSILQNATRCTSHKFGHMPYDVFVVNVTGTCGLEVSAPITWLFVKKWM